MDKKQTQYASAAPSLTDLLNLPSKTEPVKAQKPLTGLKAPVMGLAPARKPTMALKLVKRTSTVTELDHEQAKAPKVEEFNENIVEPKVAVEKVVIETVVNETLAKPIVVAETVKKPLIVETVLVAKPVSKPAKPAVNPAIVRQGGGKVWQDQSLMDWDLNHFLLFVGNLGPEVSEQLLQQTFSNPFPSVSRVRIVKDKKTDKSKGYGFVAFADGKEFLKALKEMQGRWIGNRQTQLKHRRVQGLPRLRMTQKPLEKNIRLKLGLLEARTGKTTSVAWCKSAVKNRRFAKKLDTIIGADPEAQITALRLQKIESKFHHAQYKVLVKAMKGVKTGAIQKTVKRIKQVKAEAKGSDELGKLEAELTAFKALDHAKMANFVFYSHILKDEYLQKKLEVVGMAASLADQAQATSFDLSPKIVSSKSFQDAVKAEREDLIIFFKKLFHEPLPRTQTRTGLKGVQAKDYKVSGNTKAESYFVSSLNVSESEQNDVSDTDSFVGVRSSALVFTDDEEEGSYKGSSDESDDERRKPGQPKKKKNRLGQLARRRLAEKMHGQNAKHLQKGELSVKEREELRKKRAAQKQARGLRIKEEKEKAKKEELEAKQNASKPDPSLHPSWAAKLQNQKKIYSASFKGQKIKFDDETKPENTTKRIPEISKKQRPEISKTKKQKLERKPAEAPKIDPKLHPSWAAKLQQQHKTNSTAFQGQKIKFDDDE